MWWCRWTEEKHSSENTEELILLLLVVLTTLALNFGYGNRYSNSRACSSFSNLVVHSGSRTNDLIFMRFQSIVQKLRIFLLKVLPINCKFRGLVVSSVLHISLLVELGLGILLETCLALPRPRVFSLDSFHLVLGLYRATICGVADLPNSLRAWYAQFTLSFSQWISSP